MAVTATRADRTTCSRVVMDGHSTRLTRFASATKTATRWVHHFHVQLWLCSLVCQRHFQCGSLGCWFGDKLQSRKYNIQNDSGHHIANGDMSKRPDPMPKGTVYKVLSLHFIAFCNQSLTCVNFEVTLRVWSRICKFNHWYGQFRWRVQPWLSTT